MFMLNLWYFYGQFWSIYISLNKQNQLFCQAPFIILLTFTQSHVSQVKTADWTENKGTEYVLRLNAINRTHLEINANYCIKFRIPLFKKLLIPKKLQVMRSRFFQPILTYEGDQPDIFTKAEEYLANIEYVDSIFTLIFCRNNNNVIMKRSLC